MGAIRTISDARAALLSKRVSVRELFEKFALVAKKNEFNEFITLTPASDNLLDASQKRIDDGCPLPLDGIPFAAKDLFCTNGIRTTCASRMLSDFQPKYESTITQKLFDNGCLIVGKTNMDEFAMGSSTTHTYFGRCFNPYRDPKTGEMILNAGGSSGGSAVSVASCSSIFALGSDTGGSIRQPAALCGVFGMKPTYGLCSRYGMISYASSFDQAGVLANSAEDIGIVLDTICGFDERDSTMLPSNKYSELGFSGFMANIGQDVSNLRIGVIEDAVLDIINPEMAKVIRVVAEKLAQSGAKVEDNIKIRYLNEALAVYFIITPAECFSNFARYDGIRFGYAEDISKFGSIDEMYIQNRSNGFGQEVQKRLLMGSFVLSKENYENCFVNATKVRRLIKNEFNRLFNKYDILLLPTVADVAQDPDKQPDNEYLNDQFTVSVNCAGLPSISVPFGKSIDGLPLSFQIVSGAFNDSKLIQVADFITKQR